MNETRGGATGSPIWGGVLGGVLLGWVVLILLAPEMGSLVAVFGSPVLAWFVLVRLVGGGSSAQALRTPDGANAGPTHHPALSDLRADVDLLARVSARSGGVCAVCGARGPLTLHAILPIGRSPRALDQRFEARCAACVPAHRA